MDKRTKLENLILGHPKYQELSEDVSRKERQQILDLITKEVLQQLTPEEISEHVRVVYNETIGEYVNAKIDKLIELLTPKTSTKKTEEVTIKKEVPTKNVTKAKNTAKKKVATKKKAKK